LVHCIHRGLIESKKLLLTLVESSWCVIFVMHMRWRGCILIFLIFLLHFHLLVMMSVLWFWVKILIIESDKHMVLHLVCPSECVFLPVFVWSSKRLWRVGKCSTIQNHETFCIGTNNEFFCSIQLSVSRNESQKVMKNMVDDEWQPRSFTHCVRQLHQLSFVCGEKMHKRTHQWSHFLIVSCKQLIPHRFLPIADFSDADILHSSTNCFVLNDKNLSTDNHDQKKISLTLNAGQWYFFSFVSDGEIIRILDLTSLNLTGHNLSLLSQKSFLFHCCCLGVFRGEYRDCLRFWHQKRGDQVIVDEVYHLLATLW